MAALTPESDAQATSPDADVEVSGDGGQSDVDAASVASTSTTTPIGPALLEVVDRDDHVRQAWRIEQWPVRVGRSLDNDISLTDPHLAAHHFSLDLGADGLTLQTGDTVNGVLVENKRLRGHEAVVMPADREAIHLLVGRTRLRLRLAGTILAPEKPLATIGVRDVRIGITLALAGVLLLAIVFNAYLNTDPTELVRNTSYIVLAALTASAIWCGAWALLSKTITRQSHLGWHARVFTLAGVSLAAVAGVAPLVGYAMSWPSVMDFSFIATYGIVAIALYFHLLAVEPARPRLLRWIVATGAAVMIGLTLWFNLQRSERLGDDLYMSQLFPPGFRLVKPQPVERFVKDLEALRKPLDAKAQEVGGPAAAGTDPDDDDD